MSKKEDLTGEPICLVADESYVRIPEGMVQADGSMATHIDLENGPPCRLKIMTKKGIIDHGLMHDPNHPNPRFPSSRDWNMPTIKCESKDCVANYHGGCVMPSCITIGPNGKCTGRKNRKPKDKKSVKRAKVTKRKHAPRTLKMLRKRGK